MSNLSELENQAFTVSEFVKQTNAFFERLGYVLIKGEISQLSNYNHLYYSIKDDNALVDCLMFRGDLLKLNFEPKVGQKVIVYGKNSVYPKNGSFKLVVKQMELAGLGQIMEQLRLLDIKLAQEGVYDTHRSLPEVIENVAVVTSTEGRVIDDIRTNVYRRNPLVNLFEFPCLVQGTEAPASIVKALYQAYELVDELNLDVIIVGRGGGSFEDLLCFSDERVVRAVAASPIPIISAVGHDEDRPLCDKSADLRVSTPTAAAERVTPILYIEYVARIMQAMDKLYNSLGLMLDSENSRINNNFQRLLTSSVFQTLEHKSYILDNLLTSMDRSMQLAFARQDRKINYLVNSLEQVGVQERLHNYIRRIDSAQDSLERFAQSIEERSNALNRAIEYLFSKNFTQKINDLNHNLEQNLVKRLDKSLQDKLDRLDERLKRAEESLRDYANRKLYEISNIKANLINGLEARLEQAINMRLMSANQRITLQERLLEIGADYDSELPSYFDTKLMHGAKEKLNTLVMSLEKVEDLALDYDKRLSHLEINLDRFYDKNINLSLKEYESSLSNIITKLQSLNPLYQLERGLSLTTVDGTHSVKGVDLQVGDEIITIMKDYHVNSTINSITYKPNNIDADHLSDL